MRSCLCSHLGVPVLGAQHQAILSFRVDHHQARLLITSKCVASTAEVSKPGDKQPELPASAGQGSIHRLDELRFSKGPLHTSKIRAKLQKDMQTDAAVFRTQVGLPRP